MKWWLFLGLSIVSGASYGRCPLILWGYEVRKFMPPKAARKALTALRFSAVGSAEEVPLQIDPVDGQGKLIFFANQDWLDQPLEDSDRISIASEAFGVKWPQHLAACGGKPSLAVAKGADQFLYLAACPQKKTFPSVVKHVQRESRVSSPTFNYRYASYNHLLFQDISFNLDTPYVYPYQMALDSDQLIIADISYLFKMHFGAHDFDVKIINQREGPLALVGRLSFILKILMFEIDLELLPEVSFFESAINMPMVMHFPIDAASHLEKGSGLFYTWRPSEHFVWDDQRSTVPGFNAGSLDQARHCRDLDCSFQLVGKLGTKFLVLDFILPRYLIELGFYPQWLKDLGPVEKLRGEAVSSFANSGRMGVYFETSRLPKGSHLWQFWLRVEEDPKRASQTCQDTSVKIDKF